MTTAARPTGPTAVKAAVRAAATRLFADHGFVATGVRDIARAAGTDPALIIRYFGSKEGLFLDTVRMPASWADLFAGPIDRIGERIARSVIEARGEPLAAYAALIRASDRPEVRTRLQESMVSTFVEPIMRRLDPAGAEFRAHLFAAQLEGLLIALAVREDPVFLETPVDDLVAWYGPILQATIVGPTPAS